MMFCELKMAAYNPRDLAAKILPRDLLCLNTNLLAPWIKADNFDQGRKLAELNLAYWLGEKFIAGPPLAGDKRRPAPIYLPRHMLK